MKLIEKPKHKRFIDLEGRQYEHWLVLGYAGKHNKKHRWWCKCNCVKQVIKKVINYNLNGSCGCHHIKQVTASNTTHGMWGSTEYTSYSCAKSRCNNTNDTAYKYYGGRGIKFKFNSFEEFLDELGTKSNKNLTVDRIDVNGHYEKGNVRWITQAEQLRNTTRNITIKLGDLEKSVKEWSEITGISDTLIYSRRKNNWCSECTLTLKTFSSCKHRTA